MLPIIKLVNEGDITNCRYERLNDMEMEFIKANYFNNSILHVIACAIFGGAVGPIVFNNLSLMLLTAITLSAIVILSDSIYINHSFNIDRYIWVRLQLQVDSVHSLKRQVCFIEATSHTLLLAHINPILYRNLLYSGGDNFYCKVNKLYIKDK